MTSLEPVTMEFRTSTKQLRTSTMEFKSRNDGVQGPQRWSSEPQRWSSEPQRWSSRAATMEFRASTMEFKSRNDGASEPQRWSYIGATVRLSTAINSNLQQSNYSKLLDTTSIIGGKCALSNGSGKSPGLNPFACESWARLPGSSREGTNS
jgi:hypothetical protein